MEEIKADGSLSILRLRPNQVWHYHFDGKIPWGPWEIFGEWKLQKGNELNLDWTDYTLLTGSINVQYNVECVRCLESMPTQQFLDLRCMIIPEHFTKDKQWANETNIFFQDEEYQLHFLDKNSIHLHDLIQEYIALEEEEFPLHDPNCQGLCPECGENLNKISCSHKRQT